MFDRTYVGIAATGPLAVDTLRRVTASSPEWKSITAAIVPIFDRRAHGTGVAAALLARVPMTVDWVFAASSGAQPPTYYFEASKRIPDAGDTPSEDPRGVVRIAASGWLRASDSGFVPAGTAGEFSWEPEDEGFPPPVQLPLGVLRHGSDRVWVMKGRVGTRDVFTLYALGAGGVRTLFTVDAAAC